MRASKIIFISLIILWIALPLTAPYKIVFLGFIAVYLAVHNMLALRLAEKRNVRSNKREFMHEKFGPKWGPKMYNILFILAPFIAGLYVIGNGFLMAIGSS